MGVYGDFLGPFTELFEDYEIAECTPKVGGGFDVKPIRTIHGYIQDGESGLNVRDNYSRNALSSGSGSGVVSELNMCYLYTYEPLNLMNNFVMYKGSPYRPMVDSDYIKEGSFIVTELHKVVGTTGISETTIELAKGAFD